MLSFCGIVDVRKCTAEAKRILTLTCAKVFAAGPVETV